MCQNKQQLDSFMKSLQASSDQFSDEFDRLHYSDLQLKDSYEVLQTTVKRGLVPPAIKSKSQFSQTESLSAFKLTKKRSVISKKKDPNYIVPINSSSKPKVFAHDYQYRHHLFRSMPNSAPKRIFQPKITSTFIEDEFDNSNKVYINPYLHVGDFNEDEIDWNQLQEEDQNENNINPSIVPPPTEIPSHILI